MTTRQKILQKTFAGLLHASCWAVRVLYRLLYGWGKYRPFIWNYIDVASEIHGRSRTHSSPTPESEARRKAVDQAVKDGRLVLKSGDAFDKLAKKHLGRTPKPGDIGY